MLAGRRSWIDLLPPGSIFVCSCTACTAVLCVFTDAIHCGFGKHSQCVHHPGVQSCFVVVKVAHQPEQLEHEYGINGDVRTILGWPASSVFRTSAIVLATFIAAGFYFRHQRRHSAAATA